MTRRRRIRSCEGLVAFMVTPKRRGDEMDVYLVGWRVLMDASVAS